MASSVWRFTDDKGVEREISTVDLRAALMKGTLLPSTLVWREGMKEWVPAFTLPDLASAAIAAARVDRQKAGPPSVPPGTPIQRKKPTQTLQGIDPISLGNEAAAALMRIRGGQDAPPAPSPPAEPFNRASAPDSDDTLQEAVNKIVAPAPDPLAPRVVKTQPTGSLGTAIAATDIIPRAPKLPNMDAETGRPKSMPPGPPPPRPKSIPPGGATRPKSMPPPLPPRSVRNPIAGTSADAANANLPRKQTLLGMSAVIGATPASPTQTQGPRSKPPPPPRRNSMPSIPPGGVPPAPPTQVQGTPARVTTAAPNPPLRAPIQERPKPPSPPKRSVRPPALEASPAPPPVLPAQLTPTELAPYPNQPTPAAMPPSDPSSVGTTTATLGTITAPLEPSPAAGLKRSVVDEPTDPLSNSQILGARELLASIGDPEDENTVTLTKSAGEIVKEVRNQPRPAKVPKRVQIAQQQAAQAAQAAHQRAAEAAATPIAPGNDTQPLPAQPAPDTATEGAAIAEAASEPAPPVRQRTMEMTLADHEDAALSQPIPGSQRPGARKEHSITEKLPAIADGSDAAEAADAKPAPTRAKAEKAERTERTDKRSSSRPPDGRSSRPDRASFTDEADDDGEYKIRRRAAAPVEVPRRSIVGASLLWMVGLVIFFFVGRCAGYSRAAQYTGMRSGVGRAFLAWSSGETRAAPTTTAAAADEVKPCWVARQPTKWAPSATKYVPIDMEPIEGSMSFGFGLTETEAAGIVVEPKSGKFEQKFSQKLESKEKAKIARVVPMPSREGGYFVSKKGDRDFMPILGADPFFLVFSKESIGWAASDDAEPTEIFPLVGEGDVSSQRVLDEGTLGYFVSFRRGNVVYGGYFDKQKKALGSLTAIPGSSDTAEEGKPKSGFNGEETAVVFGERAEKKGPWTVRLGHAKAGTVPTTTEVLTFPDGGPGGDVFAPDVVGLPDGRWLVMWTEGDATSAIRALTYSKDFQPIGDPIALSPPGDFGQAVLGNAAGYTIVAFFQRNQQGDFELWGAVLKCG